MLNNTHLIAIKINSVGDTHLNDKYCRKCPFYFKFSCFILAQVAKPINSLNWCTGLPLKDSSLTQFSSKLNITKFDIISEFDDSRSLFEKK